MEETFETGLSEKCMKAQRNFHVFGKQVEINMIMP